MAKPSIPLAVFLSCALFWAFTLRSSAQSCNSLALQDNSTTPFPLCSDLPALSCSLHWTPNINGTVNIAFRSPAALSNTWHAWGMNNKSAQMVGTQALVASVDSTNKVSVWTSSVDSTSTQLGKTNISYNVTGLRAQLNQDSSLVIFATLHLSINLKTVSHVWQTGPFSSGRAQTHPLSGPNVQSVGTWNLSSTASPPSARIPRLRRKNVHGVLNAVSWGILMPIGAMIARYLKVSRAADPAWFYLHIFCQVSAYGVGVAGWGTGLKLGSESSGVTYNPHRRIGIAMFCLATLQVFALLLRPKKDHKFRLYWNIYHHSVGYTVIILSVINVYKGLDILDPEKKWKRAYTGVIIALAAVALLLEAFTWMVVLRRKKTEAADKSHQGGANGVNVL